MKRIIEIVVILSSVLFSSEILSEVQKNGLILMDKSGKDLIVHRKMNSLCRKNLTVETLFSGDYAGEKVSEICKKSVVTQLGVLQPMTLSKDIKTVGELELLVHIKKIQEDSSAYILIDARGEEWFNKMTIPSAVSLPFDEIDYEKGRSENDFDDAQEYEEYQAYYKKMFKILNIKQTKSGLDFSKAKSALLFCNASWCSQSPRAIYNLINMGYPKEKLLWYRGGLQDWLIYDFPVVRGGV